MTHKRLPDTDPPAHRPDRSVPETTTWLGVRVSALAEITLFLAFALAIDAIFFQGDRFWHVTPHPFWIIVVLASVQYGTPAGLLAAVLASIALLAFNLPVRLTSQDLYEYVSLLVQHPSLWVLATVVLGELRMRQLVERDHLRSALVATERRECDIRLAFTQILAQNQQLERRLAAQSRTVSAVLHDIIELESGEPEALWAKYADLCLTWLGADQCSVYLLDQSALVLSVQRGWTNAQTHPLAVTADSPLFRAVVAQRRNLYVTDPADEAILSGQGIMAGGLIHPKTGEVFGMLKVESLGLVDLNVSTIGSFQALCRWGGLVAARGARQACGPTPTRPDRAMRALPLGRPSLRHWGAVE